MYLQYCVVALSGVTLPLMLFVYSAAGLIQSSSVSLKTYTVDADDSLYSF